MAKRPLGQRLHALYRRIETASHPLYYLFLEITRRCNLSCLHCGSDCRSGSSPELSTESWLKIIDYLALHFSPLPAIVITGGEPMVHPDLPVIARTLSSRGFRWGMVSNGYVHDSERWAPLVEAGLKSVTISLDGDEETHGYLRRNPRSYRNAVRTLEFLVKSPVARTDVVTCAFPFNLDRLDAAAETLVDLGVGSWRIFRIFASGRAAEHPELMLDAEENRRMLAWIEHRRAGLAKRGLDLQLSCEGYLAFGADRAVRAQPFFCRSGINIASILADGTITGCSNNHPDFAQGNILTDDFASVWNHGFADFRTRDWVPAGFCRDCPEWKYCGGSSMHLWKKGGDRPNFCYLYDWSDGSADARAAAGKEPDTESAARIKIPARGDTHETEHESLV